MTRKSLAWPLPRLPFELEDEEFELDELDDEVAGVDEGAEDESGCWLGWVDCESGGGGVGAGCWALVGAAKQAKTPAHTNRA
jgi:hypothetical protein